MKTMKFASWNVARKAGGIPALIEYVNPDIAFLQECQDPESLKLDGYQVIGRSIDERGRKESWGNAIISKFSLSSVEIDGDYRGSMICATVAVSERQTLGLINLYGLLEGSPLNPKVKFVHPGIHRMLSDASFWLAGAQTPKVDGFIVGGDLNKDRKMDGKPSLRTGRSIASNLIDRFSDFGLQEVDLGGVQTFTHSSSKSTWQIDHVFLSEFLTAASSASVINDPSVIEHSDHKPILVEFSERDFLKS